ncbi:Predicted helicase [Candidatus Bartonella washoeensis]|uniref:Uncharacterized protein n=1 Tax=Candidatus Bartonella washoeensis Sb944nv TaxID=1094563 RepID=J0Q0X9_9HYPH|nr:hypothetical protein MCQ_01005 [Bartonella washoeensis Sb944nv]SPU27766.1 Predicted helicase [Bartonella washoeensis]
MGGILALIWSLKFVMKEAMLPFNANAMTLLIALKKKILIALLLPRAKRSSPIAFLSIALKVIGVITLLTTGAVLRTDNSESEFVKVHDNSIIRSQKRLYMTA